MKNNRVIKRIVWAFLFFAMVICLGKQKAYAKESMKAGDVFYTKFVKCRVLTPSNICETGVMGTKYGHGGTAEVIGINSHSNLGGIISVAPVELCEETNEYFDIVSVKKNAFRGSKKNMSVAFTKGDLYPGKKIHLKKGCFKNCINLQNLDLSASVVVDKDAFAGCKRLSNIFYQDNLDYVFKKGSFSGTKNVKVETYGSNNRSETAKNMAKQLRKAGSKKVRYYYYNRNRVI